MECGGRGRQRPFRLDLSWSFCRHTEGDLNTLVPLWAGYVTYTNYGMVDIGTGLKPAGTRESNVVHV